MSINVLTPFMDAQACAAAEQLRAMPFFATKPAYMDNLRRVLLEEPVTCQGNQCTLCRAPVLVDTVTQTPEDHECDPDYPEMDLTDEEAEELSDALDAALDNDYDW